MPDRCCWDQLYWSEFTLLSERKSKSPYNHKHSGLCPCGKTDKTWFCSESGGTTALSCCGTFHSCSWFSDKEYDCSRWSWAFSCLFRCGSTGTPSSHVGLHNPCSYLFGYISWSWRRWCQTWKTHPAQNSSSPPCGASSTSLLEPHKQSACKEWFYRREGDRHIRCGNDSAGIAEWLEKYWRVAIALLFKVVEEAGLTVGISAFVVERVKEGTALSMVLLL